MKQEHTEAATSLEEVKQRIKTRLLDSASRGRYRLNPKPAVVEYVLQGLAENEVKHGFAYCPCKVPQGEPEKDKDIVCPCASLADEVREYGQCDCALFISGESEGS